MGIDAGNEEIVNVLSISNTTCELTSEDQDMSDFSVTLLLKFIHNVD